MIGKKLDSYEIISLIGRGGMGTVYKAYDTKLERYVAIKILNRDIVDKPSFRERFKKEAQNQAKLINPNIVTVYGFIEAEDNFGIVMEYIEGDTLEHLIFKRGKFHIYDVIIIARQILSAIGFAHSKGFIHRDIKPSNIIFKIEDNTVKIMDFGISKSILDNKPDTKAKVGTAIYMAPEQIKGENVSIQADIYSIGITLYEMLTGEPPFNYENEFEVLEAHLKKAVPRINDPHIPDEINPVLQKALAKKSGNRFKDCNEFYESLEVFTPMLEEIHSLHKGRIKKNNSTKKKVYSVLATILFASILIMLSYFVYGKVHSFLANKEYEKYKKYSYDVLFEDDENFKLNPIKLDNKENLTAIGIFENRLFIAGEAGNLYEYDERFNQIAKTNLDSTLKIKDIETRAGKIVLLDEAGKYLFRDIVGSSEWRVKKFPEGLKFGKILFTDDFRGFIVGSKGIIFKTTDGGKNWKFINSGNSNYFYDIKYIESKQRILVSSRDGYLYYSDDFADSWNKYDKFAKKYIKSIAVSESGDIAVSGAKGEIFFSRNFGESWKKIELQLNEAASNLIFYEEYLFVFTDKGRILVKKLSGEQWNEIKTDKKIKINDVIKSGNHLFCVGINGRILDISKE